ncbi:MAG: DUF2490 domain-containing protein, partial [Planctomycetales bacterium]
MGFDIDENRIWQQLTWSDRIGRFSCLLRPRLEQRFLTSGNDMGLRFRQFVKLWRPLSYDPRFSLVSWDELFIHLNDTDWGARAGFNQNRLFVGVGWDPNSNDRWRTEIGYLYQEINVPGVGNNMSNHILSINFFRAP